MDDDLLARGHEAIARATQDVRANVSSREPLRPTIVIEQLRQFGDVLHSTLVVRHIRQTRPEALIVWAIMEPYVDAFEHFSVPELGPHAIVALPVVPPHPDDRPYRIAWVEKSRTLPHVERAFGCGVGTWGWKRGTIVDAMLDNAAVDQLAVPRRPWLPLSVEDAEAASAFISRHGLHDRPYFTLEFSSHSLPHSGLTDAWYAALVAGLPAPVIALGSRSDRLPDDAIDGRGTGFRLAKALIAGSSCFIGRGSGLSVLAASNGCEQSVVEIVDPALSMVGIGYRKPGDRHRVITGSHLVEVVAAVEAVARRTLS